MIVPYKSKGMQGENQLQSKTQEKHHLHFLLKIDMCYLRTHNTERSSKDVFSLFFHSRFRSTHPLTGLAFSKNNFIPQTFCC